MLCDRVAQGCCDAVLGQQVLAQRHLPGSTGAHAHGGAHKLPWQAHVQVFMKEHQSLMIRTEAVTEIPLLRFY
jgi:hypothetical protein